VTSAKLSNNDFSNFGAFAPQGTLARLLDLTRNASGSWAGQKRAFVLRSIAMKALAGRPLDVEAFGARMRLYPNQNACEKRILFTPQYFDAIERNFLQSRMRRDPILIDIGANIGAFSLSIAACAGPQARILAIEPQPEIFERLVYNIDQNPFATIKALECAVADLDAEITLFIDAENRGKTSMRRMNSGALGQTVKVQAKALVTIIEEEALPRIDVLNLDVEGAEDLILEPLFRLAPRSLWPRLLLIECMPECWEIDLPGLLAGLGYRQVRKTGQKAIYDLL
jgi:FkbM family methyltransferase